MKSMYSDTLAEYRVIREGIGVTDYEGAGLFRVSGPGAGEFLRQTSTRSVDFLLDGQISVALALREDGTVVAELQIHRDSEDYLVEVWPTQREAARDHLQQAAKGADGVVVTDVSDSFRVFGVEGPAAFKAVQNFLPFPIASMAYRSFAATRWQDTVDLLVSRIGVTGEYGYRVHVPVARADALREELIRLGGVPVGLDAVDICRMEMRFVNLEGESGGSAFTPFDLGVQWMCDFQSDFTGKAALLAFRQAGTRRLPVCWVADETLETLPAHGAPVSVHGLDIGEVDLAVHSPALGRIIGTARVDKDVAAPGVEYELAGHTLRTVSAPFHVASSFGVPLE
jgi:aminomethyltransferase